MRRFLRYISKVYRVREVVKGYDDYRQPPQSAPAQVFLAAFWLWVFQWRSLHQLERRMAEDAWRHGQVVPGRSGSVDTIAYALKRAALVALRRGLQGVVQRAQRAKVWHPGSVGPWHVIPVDGTELWATRRRHCSECQVRLVGPKHAPVQEYDHRAVVCQTLGTPPRMPQDVEGLWAGQPPVATWVRDDGQPVEAWEARAGTSWEEGSVPLRVVRFREASPDGVVRDHVFATTCPAAISLPYRWRCAHARWQIENTGFHDLKHHWHASHCSVHHPVAIEALLLIGLLAVNLVWAYLYRHLVPYGYRGTVMAIVEVVAIGSHRLCAPLRWTSPYLGYELTEGRCGWWP